MNNSVKPFIRWAGGKQHQTDWISSQIPFKRISKYFEPFLGAGSIFLYNDFSNAFLSDVNEQLINTYLSIKEDPVKVYNSLEKFLNSASKEGYYKLREDYNAQIKTRSIEQSARFIFLIQSSFNGIYRVNTKGIYNVPFGKIKPSIPSLEKLQKIHEKLVTCELAVCSYEKIDSSVSSRDFVYLDPPYPPLNDTSSFQHYTPDRFPHSEQIRLAEFANQLSKRNVFVAISNADLESVRKLYKGWNIVTNKVTRYISCKITKQKIQEILIKNY